MFIVSSFFVYCLQKYNFFLNSANIWAEKFTFFFQHASLFRLPRSNHTSSARYRGVNRIQDNNVLKRLSICIYNHLIPIKSLSGYIWATVV